MENNFYRLDESVWSNYYYNNFISKRGTVLLLYSWSRLNIYLIAKQKGVEKES